MVRKTLNRIIEAGNSRFANENEIKANRLSNQVMLLMILLILIVSIAFSIMYFYQYLGQEKYWLYPAVCFACFLSLVGCYALKNITRYITFFEAMAYFSGLAMLTALVLFAGRDSWIYYYFLPLLWAPYIASRASLFLKVLCFFICAIVYMVVVFYIFQVEPLLPSEQFTGQLSLVTVVAGTFVVFVGSFGVMVVNYKTEILAYLERMSIRGVQEEHQTRERKAQVLVNQILIICTASILTAMVGEAIVYPIVLQIDTNAYLNFAFIFGPVTLAMYLAFTILLAMRERLNQDFTISVGVLLIGGHNFYWAISFGKEFSMHLFFVPMAIIIMVFINVVRNRIIVLLLMINFAFMIGAIAFYKFSPPLFPLPVSIVNFFEILMPFMITLISMSIVYYFSRETIIAETSLEKERNKSDKLLLNILPKEVADELRETGAATPVRYESVSVLFTDFVGFTSIAEKLQSEKLIAELDKCFSYFDAVTRRNKLEKIKTIGDSYMLAGGLPNINRTHAIDCLLAAMEMQEFMRQLASDKNENREEFWNIRIGINTGSLVAGVIGEMKFAYDVFGDTVNTASRMESSGETGKINISSSTYSIVSRLFDCEHRGQIEAKNKGKIDMYFAKGIRGEFSERGEGKIPNADFKEVYTEIANS